MHKFVDGQDTESMVFTGGILTGVHATVRFEVEINKLLLPSLLTPATHIVTDGHEIELIW